MDHCFTTAMGRPEQVLVWQVHTSPIDFFFVHKLILEHKRIVNTLSSLLTSASTFHSSFSQQAHNTTQKEASTFHSY